MVSHLNSNEPTFGFNNNKVMVNRISRSFGDDRLHVIRPDKPLHPEQIVNTVHNGKSVFIDTRFLFTHPQLLSEFLYHLELLAKRYKLKLSQISPEVFVLNNLSSAPSGSTPKVIINSLNNLNISPMAS